MDNDKGTLADIMTNMFRKQDVVSANTIQLVYQQSRTLEELNKKNPYLFAELGDIKIGS